MADQTTNTDNTQAAPDKLSDIIRSIIPHIPGDKMAALLNHPHAQDVIDAAGQAAAKAAGVDTIAHPDNSATTNQTLPPVSPEDAARLQAINDMVQQQQKARAQQETDPQNRGDAPKDDFTTMLKGVGKLVTDGLIHGYNQSIKGK
jgi:hypothetical protein